MELGISLPPWVLKILRRDMSYGGVGGSVSVPVTPVHSGDSSDVLNSNNAALSAFQHVLWNSVQWLLRNVSQNSLKGSRACVTPMTHTGCRWVMKSYSPGAASACSSIHDGKPSQ